MKNSIRQLIIALVVASFGTHAAAECSSGYLEYDSDNSTLDQAIRAADSHGSNAIVCMTPTYIAPLWCESWATPRADRLLDEWRDSDRGIYFCVPQSRQSYSGWGGSPSAGQTVLGGLVGLLAWGLANSNSGQSSSGSGNSRSVPDTSAAEQGRREQEFIQLQRQEQQMRQQHPPQH